MTLIQKAKTFDISLFIYMYMYADFLSTLPLNDSQLFGLQTFALVIYLLLQDIFFNAKLLHEINYLSPNI